MTLAEFISEVFSPTGWRVNAWVATPGTGAFCDEKADTRTKLEHWVR
jgi:hypothetical protein